MSEYTKITVLGTGVLGSQIAFQTAYSGFDVSVYDINQAALDAAKERFEGLTKTYLAEVASATQEKVDAAVSRISYFDDLPASVADADLVIEAIPEILDLKRSTWAKVGEAAPERTVFATNSSTLLPSDISDATGRPDRFLALHFANRVWSANTAEVMGTPETSPAVFDSVVAFAGEIGMVAIPIHKEKAGYLLNSLLVPFLNAAAGLAAGGYAEPKDVDNVWRISTGSPVGPFQIYDIIGLTTPYNIMAAGDDDTKKLAAWLKENYIDKGRLGLASGHGFYDYK
ncbi:3-hydroxyacyl-CoA dehydrogenase [Gordonia sp. (in: high G+C Gram-positive bacteria)]|uniref:3-hydroxyacyl-CoA dehydrogenase n=1 Tax=Gordonia sp. (in: high G+C Gram-positive bacteria) TaxID=84139 RepID=UPI00168EE1D2|nr:3-hydroxyacyl-CoA dehydrogenase [Gordonia sp. (in: high G+C Gram-positive bacteria)]NLG47365.1 3-hydroxyacyl-CoA dehydrogenase [Gordonia sp. (in: high G+C Gram-positive bacteria)]